MAHTASGRMPLPGNCIALLRGINVGRAKRVAMADLRLLIAGLGYSDVHTLLNSGNVLFNCTDAAHTAAKRISDALVEQLGISSLVVVLTSAELVAVVEQNTLPAVDDASRLLVVVPANSADLAKLAPLRGQDWTPEALAVGERAAYLWCLEGVLASRLPGAVEKAVGHAVTTRNWATMTKLLAMVDDQR